MTTKLEQTPEGMNSGGSFHHFLHHRRNLRRGGASARAPPQKERCYYRPKAGTPLIDNAKQEKRSRRLPRAATSRRTMQRKMFSDVGHASTAFLVAGSSPGGIATSAYIAPVGALPVRYPARSSPQSKADTPQIQSTASPLGNTHILHRAHLRFRIGKPSNGAVKSHIIMPHQIRLRECPRKVQ